MLAPKTAALVVIIGENVLRERIIQLLLGLGVTGYTLSQAQGFGHHGNRQGDMVGYNTNIEIKTLVSLAVAELIFAGLKDCQADHALIIFQQSVEVFSGLEIV